MYDYLIVHGSFGNPFENWTPWLFKELEKSGKSVLAPQFPTVSQNYENWEAILSAYDKYIGENTSIISHSLGPAFVLDYIIRFKKQVNNLYFAAPFYGLINNPKFDEVNKTFFIYPSVSEAKNYFKTALCFFSDNDPYVPREMSESISIQINAKTEVVKDGGHLNRGAGFTEFSRLLEVINKYG